MTKDAEGKRETAKRLREAKEAMEKRGRCDLIDILGLDDKQVVEKLIERDKGITADFFFRKCRPLIMSIIGNVFGGKRVDYDEVVSAIYYYLMRPNANGEDAAALRSFKFRSSLYQWLKFVISHFLLRNKKWLLNGNDNEIDLPEEEPGRENEEPMGDIDYTPNKPWAVVDDAYNRREAAKFINDTLYSMTAGKKGRALQGALRYVEVIKMKYKEMDDIDVAEELGMKTDSFYALKARAFKAFREAALNNGGTRI